MELPQIKKKVNAFLVGEEGKISKESVIKAGVLVSSVAVATISSVKVVHAGHSNVVNPPTCYDAYATATHSNHSSGTSTSTGTYY